MGGVSHANNFNHVHSGNFGRSVVFVGGFGYGGYGLYGPYGYGSGYGYPSYYGGSGYYSSPSYYDYGYPNSYPYLSTPVVPGAYYPQQYPYVPQASPMAPPVDPNAEPAPIPLPNGGNSGVGNTTLTSGGSAGSTAKVTVIASQGAKVSFDGIDSDQNSTRHSFTTKPIPAGVEVRVNVKVDGSTIAIRVRGGETATVDMRR
jgi:uncharacterized protein (TIGR03000 family)